MKPIKWIALFIAIMVCISQANAGLLGFHPFKNHKLMALGAAGIAGTVYTKNCMDDKGKMSKCSFHPGDDKDWVSGNSIDSSGNQIPEKGDSKKLRKALNLERTSSGMPPDPDKCHAHHIVPGGIKGQQKQEKFLKIVILA